MLPELLRLAIEAVDESPLGEERLRDIILRMTSESGAAQAQAAVPEELWRELIEKVGKPSEDRFSVE